MVGGVRGRAWWPSFVNSTGAQCCAGSATWCRLLAPFDECTHRFASLVPSAKAQADDICAAPGLFALREFRANVLPDQNGRRLYDLDVIQALGSNPARKADKLFVLLLPSSGYQIVHQCGDFDREWLAV